MFSNIIAGAAGFPVADLGDEISQSLRFSGSQYLSRTFGTATDQRKFTLSGWIKPALDNHDTSLGGPSVSLLGTDSGGTNQDSYGIYTTSISCYNIDGSGTYSGGFNNGVSRAMRDPSAWYHYCVAVDSTLATAADRVILWINGERQSGNLATYPLGLNVSPPTNSGARAHYIGRFNGNIESTGYMAAIYFIDGQGLDVTNFGKYNEDGVWVPQDYSGTYGNNGYKLTFDSSQTNGIGHDSSGNGNDWTATGFDTSPVGLYSPGLTANSGGSIVSVGNAFDGVTAYAAYVSPTGIGMTFAPAKDIPFTTLEIFPSNNNMSATFDGTTTNTPTLQYTQVATNGTINSTTPLTINVGSGLNCNLNAIRINGTTVLKDNIANDVDFLDTPTSNYAKLNPLNEETAANTNQLLYEANLKSSNPAWGNTGGVFVNRRFDDNDNYYFEIYIGQRGNSANQQAYPHLFWKDTTNSHSSLANSTSQSYWVDGKFDWDAGDVLRVRTVSKTQFDVSKNGGTFKRVQFPMTDPYRFGIANSDSSVAFWNFGQMPFLYDVPDGYSALQTNNLPEPTIKNGKEHFEAIIWDGNDVNDRAITTTKEFAPDLVWIKCRDSAINHFIYDTVRGAPNRLFPNLSNEEDAGAGHLKSFTSNGFTLGTSGNVNGTGNEYAAWCWKAGGTATTIAVNSITASTPSIASSVSANTDAGFSIVSYTGNLTAGATVGHGLTTAPDLIMVKSRDFAQTWHVKHSGVGNNTDSLSLDTSAAGINYNAWNNTAPGNSVFTLGPIDGTNKSGEDYIAYCWHSVPGYSAFGSYQSNNSADGVFNFLGFKPAFLLVKCISHGGPGTASEWVIFDSTRNPSNPTNTWLMPNEAIAEGTDLVVDFLSNGFKCRDNSGQLNGSSRTYVYCCFAENPFGGENAPPVTAR